MKINVRLEVLLAWCAVLLCGGISLMMSNPAISAFFREYSDAFIGGLFIALGLGTAYFVMRYFLWKAPDFSKVENWYQVSQGRHESTYTQTDTFWRMMDTSRGLIVSAIAFWVGAYYLTREIGPSSTSTVLLLSSAVIYSVRRLVVGAILQVKALKPSSEAYNGHADHFLFGGIVLSYVTAFHGYILAICVLMTFLSIQIERFEPAER